MSMPNVRDRAPARTPLAHPDHHVASAEPARPAAELHSAPAFEAWLRILLAACVPAVAAMYLPGLRTPLFVLTGALVVAALVALAREPRRRAAAERS